MTPKEKLTNYETINMKERFELKKSSDYSFQLSPGWYKTKKTHKSRKKPTFGTPIFDTNLTILQAPLSGDTPTNVSDQYNKENSKSIQKTKDVLSSKRNSVKINAALERSLQLPYEIGMGSGCQSPDGNISKDSRKRLTFTLSPSQLASPKRFRPNHRSPRSYDEVVVNSEDENHSEDESEEIDVTGYSDGEDVTTHHANELIKSTPTDNKQQNVSANTRRNSNKKVAVSASKSAESSSNKQHNSSGSSKKDTKKSFVNMETQVGSSRLTRRRKDASRSPLKVKNSVDSRNTVSGGSGQSDIDSDCNERSFKKPAPVGSAKKKGGLDGSSSFNVTRRATRSSVNFLDQLSLHSFVQNINKSMTIDEIQASMNTTTRKNDMKGEKMKNNTNANKSVAGILSNTEKKSSVADKSMNTTKTSRKHPKRRIRLTMKRPNRTVNKTQTDNNTSKVSPKHVSFLEPNPPSRKSLSRIHEDDYETDHRLIEEEDVDNYQPTGWMGVGSDGDRSNTSRNGTPRKKGSNKAVRSIGEENGGLLIDDENFRREDLSIQFKNISENTISEMVLARPASCVSFNQPRHGNGDLQLFKYFSDSALSFGQMKIKPFGRKGMQKNKDDRLVFFNLIGQLKVTIYKTTFPCMPGDCFMIPEGNIYDIVNESETEARLLFFQRKP